MKTKLGLLLVLMAGTILTACQTSTDKVPKPNNMTANVEVRGSVSKLIDLDIKHVGKQIPYTYSHNKISNSPGYEWWVSKHFAIKSDLPEHKVKLYLELLELSYPHYVSLFGAEPANIENQRIAVVYGASRESTKSTMLDDGFTRGVHKNAGGETMYYNRAGYSFPSHREQHQRYIVIHETMHAYHMALTQHSTWAPNWITEGLADSIASHVYYPETKELAVMVFDRAPMNYIHTGLKQYVKGNKPSIEQINNNPALKRGLNFFIVHFLLSDPERAYYFSLFRDRLMAANPHSGDTLPTASRLLKETFPDWQKLEKEFSEFVANIHQSFLIANGPWEQNGDKYWIRSYAKDVPARLDIRPATNQGKLNFDFPQPATTKLIKQNEQLVAGVVIEFTPEHLTRGSVGIGLGLAYSEDNKAYLTNYKNKFEAQQDSYLSIQLEQARKLTIRANQLDFSTQSYALAPEIVKAIKAEKALGITASVSNNELSLLLATDKRQQTIKLAITSELQQQIQTEALSLLANNNKHKLTPYFASQPNAEDYFNLPDYRQWTTNSKLYRMFKTCKNFDLACPEQLTESIRNLANNNVDNTEQLHSEILKLAQNNPAALTSLSGLKLSLVENNDELIQEVFLPESTSMNINSQFSWRKDNKELEHFNQLKRFSTGTQQLFIRPNNKADELQVVSNIEWQGTKFELTQTTDKHIFDGVYLIPYYQKDGNKIHISAELTGPYSGETSGTLTFEILPSDSSAKTLKTVEVTIAPYETKSWQHDFALQNTEHTSAIEVTADLVVDGEGVLLSELIYINH